MKKLYKVMSMCLCIATLNQSNATATLTEEVLRAARFPSIAGGVCAYKTAHRIKIHINLKREISKLKTEISKQKSKIKEIRRTLKDPETSPILLKTKTKLYEKMAELKEKQAEKSSNLKYGALWGLGTAGCVGYFTYKLIQILNNQTPGVAPVDPYDEPYKEPYEPEILTPINPNQKQPANPSKVAPRTRPRTTLYYDVRQYERDVKNVAKKIEQLIKQKELLLPENKKEVERVHAEIEAAKLAMKEISAEITSILGCKEIPDGEKIETLYHLLKDEIKDYVEEDEWIDRRLLNHIDHLSDEEVNLVCEACSFELSEPTKKKRDCLRDLINEKKMRGDERGELCRQLLEKEETPFEMTPREKFDWINKQLLKRIDEIPDEEVNLVYKNNRYATPDEKRELLKNCIIEGKIPDHKKNELCSRLLKEETPYEENELLNRLREKMSPEEKKLKLSKLYGDFTNAAKDIEKLLKPEAEIQANFAKEKSDLKDRFNNLTQGMPILLLPVQSLQDRLTGEIDLLKQEEVGLVEKIRDIESYLEKPSDGELSERIYTIVHQKKKKLINDLNNAKTTFEKKAYKIEKFHNIKPGRDKKIILEKLTEAETKIREKGVECSNLEDMLLGYEEWNQKEGLKTLLNIKEDLENKKMDKVQRVESLLELQKDWEKNQTEQFFHNSNDKVLLRCLQNQRSLDRLKKEISESVQAAENTVEKTDAEYDDDEFKIHKFKDPKEFAKKTSLVCKKIKNAEGKLDKKLRDINETEPAELNEELIKLKERAEELTAKKDEIKNRIDLTRRYHHNYTLDYTRDEFPYNPRYYSQYELNNYTNRLRQVPNLVDRTKKNYALDKSVALADLSAALDDQRRQNRRCDLLVKTADTVPQEAFDRLTMAELEQLERAFQKDNPAAPEPANPTNQGPHDDKSEPVIDETEEDLMEEIE